MGRCHPHRRDNSHGRTRKSTEFIIVGNEWLNKNSVLFRVFPWLIPRIIRFEDLHALFELVVLMILDERRTDTQALLL